MISDVLSDAVDQIEEYQYNDGRGDDYSGIAEELFFVKRAMHYVRLLEGLDTPPSHSPEQRRLYRIRDKARLIELQGFIAYLLSQVERDLAPDVDVRIENEFLKARVASLESHLSRHEDGSLCACHCHGGDEEEDEE